MPSASASRCSDLVLLGLDLDLGGAVGLEGRRDLLGDLDGLHDEGRVAALAAGLEGRGTEELVAQRVGEPLAEGRLDPVLDRDEQVGVAVEVGDVGPAGLLLERVLDLLAERVLDQPVPARRGCRRCTSGRAARGTRCSRSVLSLKYTATWYSTCTRSRDGAITESAVGLPSAVVFEMM